MYTQCICSEGDGIQSRFSKYHVKYIGDKNSILFFSFILHVWVLVQLGFQQNVKSGIRNQAGEVMA